MKIKNICGYALLAASLFASCSAPKDITYMQGFADGQLQAVAPQQILRVQPDDRISIVVNSQNREFAESFNLASAQYRLGQTSMQSTATAQLSAYTVDPNGDISFPLLGTLHVAGLTRHEISALIEKRLKSEGLLTDATVVVDLLSAKVAILGDVANPGEYPIDKDNLTLLQAIGKAGDLNITGQRTNVLVVREENGENRAYRVNLTATDSLMQSPAYHVCQNDVIYVEPNNMKKRQSTANGNTILTPAFWISVASLLTTITALIIR